MRNLSDRAAALLRELARDHGVGALDFDRDGLIPMTIRDTQIAVAYSPANDAFFLIAMVQASPDATARDLWKAFERSGLMAARRTRLAIEPDGRGLVLVREILVDGLAYWQLLEALDEFLADHAMALGRVGAEAPSAREQAPKLSFETLIRV